MRYVVREKEEEEEEEKAKCYRLGANGSRRGLLEAPRRKRGALASFTGLSL